MGGNDEVTERFFSERFQYQTSAFALICNLTGAVLFVVGSFMFRPGFLKDCDGPSGSIDAFLATTCASVLDNGAACYLIGSVLFTIDCLLNVCLLLQAHAGADNDSDASD